MKKATLPWKLTSPAAKVARRKKTKKAADLVLKVAYEILDDIIAPTVGIRGAWADLFLATPSTYLSNATKVAREQRKKIVTEVARRYGGDVYGIAHAWNQPLALFALAALSQSGYVRSEGSGKKTRKLTAKDAWAHLDYEDKRLARERKARAASS